MTCISMYKNLSSVNPIPIDGFWPCNRLWWWEWNYSHHIVFWKENYNLLTWNLTHILNNLKTFKKAMKEFWIWRAIFTEIIKYQHCLQVPQFLLAFVKLQTLVLFFPCFLVLCEFESHFYKYIYYGNILLHFGLKGLFRNIFLKKSFSLPYSSLLQVCNTK